MGPRSIYVTKALAGAALKAQAICRADYNYYCTAGRKGRGARRYADVCAAIRTWAAATGGESAAAATASAATRRRDGRRASALNRQIRHRESARDIGEIPATRHRRLRERCKYDLELFGWLYCRALLDHRASGEIKSGLILPLQSVILNGGQLAVEYSRGAGKTIWTIIAATWALLYGHRRFVLCVAAAGPLAKIIRRGVLDLLTMSDALLADFPAVPTVLRKIDGAPQRATGLTYKGRNVGYISTDAFVRLPMLADDKGAAIDLACGAVLACRGAGASVRGLNVGGLRPDVVIFDDPQTQKDSTSASAVRRLDEYIHSDALNLSANTDTMAAFMSITPQRVGDLAERIADRTTHPNWSVSLRPFLLNLPKSFDDDAADFCEAYHIDAANDDFERTQSRAWYAANRERFSGIKCLDPLAYNRRTEYDAVHHALNKIASIGRDAFYAEYQMQPRRESYVFEINDRLIVSRVRKGVAPGVLPPNTVFTACATDINPSYALTTMAIAFDVNLTAQVVAYVIQRIHITEEGISEIEFNRLVYEALAAHAKHIAAWGFKINRWGIDAGGKQFNAVTSFAPNARALAGVDAIPMLGRAGQNWNPAVRSRIREARNSTVPCRDAEGRFWLAFNADEFKERFQRSWLPEIGAPGGLTLFDGNVNHATFAAQIANERIKSKSRARSFDGRDRWVYQWETKGPHDVGDCGAMCYALAAADNLTGTGLAPIRAATRPRIIIE